MVPHDDRARGVTPGLRRDYAKRTADQQAAFVLPHLRPGMNLLDVGCGPGTITTGLAETVSPGTVVGLDRDPQHVEEARTLASGLGRENATFLLGDAHSLPFQDDTFDAVLENNVFVHLGDAVPQVAAEVYRVVRPEGFFAARDTNADAVMWGEQTPLMEQFDELFTRWHHSRGSDITIGKRLPAIVREAGFTETIKSVSADTKGTPEDVLDHAEIMHTLLDGPLGTTCVENGWADESTMARMREDIQEWGEHPDAFFANVHVEVIGWK